MKGEATLKKIKEVTGAKPSKNDTRQSPDAGALPHRRWFPSANSGAAPPPSPAPCSAQRCTSVLAPFVFDRRRARLRLCPPRAGVLRGRRCLVLLRASPPPVASSRLLPRPPRLFVVLVGSSSKTPAASSVRFRRCTRPRAVKFVSDIRDPVAKISVSGRRPCHVLQAVPAPLRPALLVACSHERHGSELEPVRCSFSWTSALLADRKPALPSSTAKSFSAAASPREHSPPKLQALG
ncbi:uncharacterized protein [Lolium perenne]|uniref:uncharacterized protein n=1 Tax=Lolium perenne TaxID=4522 RepID=UPI003A996B11